MTQVKLSKVMGNASGRFFTTNHCIACDACVAVAPKNFKKLADGRYVVFRQPEGPKELAATLEAYKNTLEPNGPGPCIIDTTDKKNIPEELKVD